MVLAGTRWLGIRLDLLSALLVGAVALVAALHSHNSGKRMALRAATDKLDRNTYRTFTLRLGFDKNIAPLFNLGSN